MKQFKTIFLFELKSYLKNKVFAGVTIFLAVVIAGILFFPRITALFDGGETEAGMLRKTKGLMLVCSDGMERTDELRQAFEEAFPDYAVFFSEDGIEGAKKQVASGEAECAFVIDGPTEYRYFVNNLSMYDSNTLVADELLQILYYKNSMTESGMSDEAANAVLNIQIVHETENLGKNQAKNFFYTYIMIFALYMVILLYGQMVATNVATEKSSRAMELLITSAKPASMMFGKVTASCLAGLLQLAVVFGSAVLCFRLNRSYWDINEIIASVFGMPVELLVYMLIFFVLGFLIYAFLYGAIGSTVSKVEDINTSAMPLTLLFVAGFMVVIFSMTEGNVDNTLMRVCSYVPFTSPMAMFTRIAMSTVPFYEILISIVVLIVSVVAVGMVSAKIYRVGVLLYGTTPKPGAIFKAMKKSGGRK